MSAKRFFLSLLLIIALKHHLLAAEVKICLNMIVRNESKIIERCLNQVKDLVDCISICDTGSEDNTIEVIERFIEENNIPGKVHRHVWKNFGHNRTLSFLAAQDTLRDLNLLTSNTYALLLDADMILEIAPEFTKESLAKDYYLITQKASTLSYPNIRLIKATLPWQSLGVTHEYWSSGKPAIGEIISTLQILDCNDGGCKTDKLERDVKYLTEGLKEEPNNERYMFYLAECYKFLKDYEKAIQWYQARINQGKWKEEVWYSKFMIGSCYEQLNNWELALKYYLEAYDHTPTRSEPIYNITKHYRLNHQHQLAYLFSKMGLSIPKPIKEYLFITESIYDYSFDEELSIAAYYTKHHEEGYLAANRLLLNKSIPASLKQQTYKNLTYYLRPPSEITFTPLEQKDLSAIFTKALKESNGEKEKLAFYLAGKPYNMTSKSPFTISSPLKNLAQKALIYNPKHDYSSFIIEKPPIEWRDGLLFLLKEIVHVDNHAISLHRLAYVDQNFTVKNLSKPFIFLNQTLEKCCEFEVDGKNNRLHLLIENSKQLFRGTLGFEQVELILSEA